MPHCKVHERKGVPTLSMDYMGMKEREPTEDAFPTIMIKDSETEVQYTHVIPKKGLDSYAVKKIVQDIERNFGYKKFVLKTDQEAVRSHFGSSHFGSRPLKTSQGLSPGTLLSLVPRTIPPLSFIQWRLRLK